MQNDPAPIFYFYSFVVSEACVIKANFLHHEIRIVIYAIIISDGTKFFVEFSQNMASICPILWFKLEI